MARGSQWRKWDLHIHTPETRLSDGYVFDSGSCWDEYCRVVEASDISVFGITDYYSVKNCLVLQEKFKALYPRSEKVFFPNVEMRLDVSVNRAAEEVNVHVLFDPETTAEKMAQFLTKLNTNITRAGAALPCSDLSEADVKAAAVQFGRLRSVLGEVFGQDRPYLIIVAANNAGIRPDGTSPRKLNISEEIDKHSDAFYGGPQNVDYFLREDRYDSGERSIPKPVIQCTDAHSFSEIKERSPKSFTWIKSDTTFEGLRQILFEPSCRLKIQERIPVSPPKVISSVQFSFPEGMTIVRPGSVPQLFCFSGVRGRIELSSYFTCIVGGRGTGKSTLLNLLYGALPQSRVTTFFTDNAFFSMGQKKNPLECCKAEASADRVEFLAQNEIEEFATNPSKFTEAIYSRLRTANKSIEVHEKTVREARDLLAQQVLHLKNLVAKRRLLKVTQGKLESNQKIADAISDAEYVTLTTQISERSKEELALRTDRERVEELFADVSRFLEEHQRLAEDKKLSLYANNYDRFLSELEKLQKQRLDPGHFLESKVEEDAARDGKETAERALGKYLKDLGLSPENLQDIQKASSAAIELAAEVQEQESEIETLRKTLEGFDFQPLLKQRSGMFDCIKEAVESFGSILARVNQDNPDQVAKIELSIRRDDAKIKELVFEDFQREFAELAKDIRVRAPQVADRLFEIDIKGVVEGSTSLETIRAQVAGDKQFNQYLSRIFEEEEHYQVYRCITLRRLLDMPNVLKIDVSYRGKPMEIASFGQRCTAVIVILLLFGNDPILIDEPEAHLDSALIANYLVNLIKAVKSDRQIVFATHNANFVVNADCELIYVLTMPESHTAFSPSTIEDLRNRDALLELEGGRKAFALRERKYGTSEGSQS